MIIRHKYFKIQNNCETWTDDLILLWKNIICRKEACHDTRTYVNVLTKTEVLVVSIQALRIQKEPENLQFYDSFKGEILF